MIKRANTVVRYLQNNALPAAFSYFALALMAVPQTRADDCEGDAGTALVVGKVLESKIENEVCKIRLEFTYFADHALCPVTLRPSINDWVEVLEGACPKTGDTDSGILNAYNKPGFTLEDL